MKTKFLLFIVCVLFALSIEAQKFRPAPTFLKGQENINVVFDFSTVTYNGISQESYYKTKDKEWIEEWENQRRTDIKKTLLKDINDKLKKVSVKVEENSNVEYTILIQVNDCDFSVYLASAVVKCTISIVKTGTIDVLSSIELEAAQNFNTVMGTTGDFQRMYLAFGEMGEIIGSKLAKIFK